MRNKTVLFSLVILLLLILAGCKDAGKTQTIAPFSNANWESTPQELAALHGGDADTALSVYGGNSYLYPITWLEQEGTVKYMYAENDQLVSIAFYCEADTLENLTNLYDTIRSQASQDYGNSIVTTNQDNLGDRWIRSEGNVILAAFWNKESCALQYSFLHPKISRDAEGNLAAE